MTLTTAVVTTGGGPEPDLKKTVAKLHDEESLLTVGSLTKTLLQRKMGDSPQKGTPEPEKKIWTSTS